MEIIVICNHVTTKVIKKMLLVKNKLIYHTHKKNALIVKNFHTSDLILGM